LPPRPCMPFSNGIGPTLQAKMKKLGITRTDGF